MKKQLLLLLLLSSALLSMAQDSDKKKYNRNKAIEDEIGYAEAVKVGNTIYISGVVGKGDMAVAIKKVYDALGKTLGEFGVTFQNVVKENVYAIDLDDFIKNKAIRKDYFKGDFPAATWIGVKRLYSPDLILEVELIAVTKDR